MGVCHRSARGVGFPRIKTPRLVFQNNGGLRVYLVQAPHVDLLLNYLIQTCCKDVDGDLTSNAQDFQCLARIRMILMLVRRLICARSRVRGPRLQRNKM